MRVAISVVTYNSPEELNNNIRSISESDLMELNPHIEIINNHSNFFLSESLLDNVREIHHNTLRPDFSTGHLARDWNSAIVRSIGELGNPRHDLIVLSQDDVIFKKDFFEKVEPLLEEYDFITSGWGDSVLVMQPAIVKKIGLFDERFSFIGFHEADYFLRCLMHHRQRTSLNDYFHDRVWQPCDNGEYKLLKECIEFKIQRADTDFISIPPYDDERAGRSVKRTQGFYTRLGQRLWGNKWPHYKSQGWDTFWLEKLKAKMPDTFSFMMYPYFEKDVIALKEQKYVQ